VPPTTHPGCRFWQRRHDFGDHVARQPLAAGRPASGGIWHSTSALAIRRSDAVIFLSCRGTLPPDAVPACHERMPSGANSGELRSVNLRLCLIFQSPAVANIDRRSEQRTAWSPWSPRVGMMTWQNTRRIPDYGADIPKLGGFRRVACKSIIVVCENLLNTHDGCRRPAHQISSGYGRSRYENPQARESGDSLQLSRGAPCDSKPGHRSIAAPGFAGQRYELGQH
jgi:hypothetical protein